MTNRELYLFVRGFESKYSKPLIPSLEKYLTALRSIAAPFAETEPTIKNLIFWLDAAFTHSPPDFNPESFEAAFDVTQKGFVRWENQILSQIIDLRQMSENGQLEDKYRYFGIDAPRGSRWYNFDVLTYLECAVRGMYDGYEEDEVIVLHQPAEGESTDSEIFQIDDFSWESFAELLVYGQMYE